MATQHQVDHYTALADEAARHRYVQALKGHDWQFEFTDDGRVYRRGVEQRATLIDLQRELDPDHRIWNQYAPAAHRVPA